MRSWRSVVVLAFDGGRVVGASTGVPLTDEIAAFREPFRGGVIDANEVFYCGESILLPAYRGRGIGHRFFHEREAHARMLGGMHWTAFCVVDRAADDPRRMHLGLHERPTVNERSLQAALLEPFRRG